MKEQSTVKSYVVRVYRIDTEDPRKITGLVEAMDGRGEQAPFNHGDELAALLSGWSAGSRKKRVKRKR
jgi:hypothetical protein